MIIFWNSRGSPQRCFWDLIYPSFTFICQKEGIYIARYSANTPLAQQCAAVCSQIEGWSLDLMGAKFVYGTAWPTFYTNHRVPWIFSILVWKFSLYLTTWWQSVLCWSKVIFFFLMFKNSILEEIIQEALELLSEAAQNWNSDINLDKN